MSDTYLQDFGTRRSARRDRPKTDPMAASGRWDDLYLRASKPRLPKKVRRDSMHRDTKVYLQKGCKPIKFQPNGEVGQLLGFTCDNTKYKYRLDSPSYPSRHRELSHEDKPNQKLVRVVPVGWRDVFTSLRAMVHKIRVRDPRFTRLLVRDFQLLWPMRHQLAKTINPQVDEPPIGYSDPVRVAPTPVAKPQHKPTPPANLKVLTAEYRDNQAELARLAKNDELVTKQEAARREELTARQRELFRMVGRWL